MRNLIVSLFLMLPAARVVAGDPPVPKTYTLPECQQAALRNPDALKRWALEADKSASGVSLARANMGVGVSAVARTQTALNRDILAVDASPLVSQREYGRMELTARYTLYDTGRRVDALHAARFGLISAQETVRGERIGLLLAVTDAYYAALRCQRLADSAALLIQATQAHLTQAQARYELGVVTRSDVLVAQSALASAMADAAARKLQRDAARAHLANAMGDDPAQSAPDVTPPPAEPELQTGADELIAKAVNNSPELARMGADRDSARASLSATRAERSPTVSVSTGIGYLFRERTASGASGAFAYASLSVSLPLFEGPNVRARERALSDELQLNELTAKQALYDLKETILLASATYQSGAARVMQATASVRASEEAARLAQERYAVGKGAQGDVIDALQRLASARDLLANTLSDRDEAAQNLRWTTGLYALPPLPATGTLRKGAQPVSH